MPETAEGAAIEVALTPEELKKQKKATTDRAYYLANKGRRREINQAFQARNPDYQKRWKEDNADYYKDHQKDYGKKWREDNPDYIAKYVQANPAKVRAYTIKRETAKSLRTPLWLTPAHWQEMNAIYADSKARDVPHHVDHIVPLQGKTVCGLHVPWNLQVIPATDNLAKHAKFNDWNLTPSQLHELAALPLDP